MPHCTLLPDEAMGRSRRFDLRVGSLSDTVSYLRQQCEFSHGKYCHEDRLQVPGGLLSPAQYKG